MTSSIMQRYIQQYNNLEYTRSRTAVLTQLGVDKITKSKTIYNKIILNKICLLMKPF